MVVYKEWPGCKELLSMIKDYKGLEIEAVRQDAGLFEEALNTLYRKADGDIVVNTDSDAHVSRNWVKEHLDIHRKIKNAGMATGMVDESTFADGSALPFFTRKMNEWKWLMNKHTLMDLPIDPKFKDYGMYIGKSGMLVDTGKRHNLIKTFKQHGVNMSWKRDALHGFRLPGYTKKGGRNEAAAALEVLFRGFTPIWFDRAMVHHPLHQSDSRSTSIASLPQELTAESVLFSYYVSRMYDVDLETLKSRTDLDNIIAGIVTLRKNKGYSIGYRIAHRAITEGWSAHRVRSALNDAFSKGK